MSDLETLKAKATDLGLSFPANIGADTLAAKVAEAEAAKTASAGATTPPEQGADKKKPAAKPKAAKPAKEAKPAKSAGASECVVLDRVRRGGRLYEIGDPIELTKADQLELAAAGVVASPENTE